MGILGTHVWHFLSDMGHTVQTAQTVQRIDEAGDEADTVVTPAGIVDPGLEDKGSVLMGRCAGNDRDENNQPSNLEVEKREFVECWDDLVSEQNHSCCEGIEDLVDDKSLPGLEGLIRVVKCI